MGDPIRIFRAMSKADLEELRELDKQGKLVHGGSYPTAEQFAADEAVQGKIFLQSEMKGCFTKEELC